MDLDTIVNWGRDLLGISYSSGSTTGCSTPDVVDRGPASTAPASDPITLSRPEVDAIMAMTPGRGNACGLIALTSNLAAPI